MKPYLTIQNHNGMNVYYLNKEGREWIGSEHEVKWSLQAEHYLMRNTVYIHYGCPDSWEIEKPVYFRPVIGNTERYIIPDARFEIEGRKHFVEIDRTQSMSVNKKKLEEYAQISPLMETDLGHKPVIIFFTLKESRKNLLAAQCKEWKLDCDILTYDEIR
jgi:hypothetical protein